MKFLVSVIFAVLAYGADQPLVLSGQDMVSGDVTVSLWQVILPGFIGLPVPSGLNPVVIGAVATRDPQTTEFDIYVSFSDAAAGVQSVALALARNSDKRAVTNFVLMMAAESIKSVTIVEIKPPAKFSTP